jgi:hypothetical protein
MTETLNSLKINFTLQEIKQLVIDNIDLCQNVRSELFMSRLKSYTELHTPLINFYEMNKTIKPTMADKLCFVILLSYPKQMIEELNDISDIKLFSNDNSDFIYKEEQTLNHEEDESEKYDCICSYEKLQKIHYVENKYSGITLQVGSECITKYSLISRVEYKKFKETELLLKEKRREIKENKPIGYYKEEKRIKKEQKEKNKLEKEMEQKQKKINTGKFKICYACCINLVDIRIDYLCICEHCKHTYNNEIFCSQIKKYGRLNECENCSENFIDTKQINPYLCKCCKNEKKIVKCSMVGCSSELMVDISLNTDIYCDDCEKKIIKCIDCKKQSLQMNNNGRCYYCQTLYDNCLINKKCIRCNEDMLVKKLHLWKTYCNSCYVEIKDICNNPPNCKCGTQMVERTIRKEGLNKGRIGLGCDNFPNGCKEFKML